MQKNRRLALGLLVALCLLAGRAALAKNPFSPLKGVFRSQDPEGEERKDEKKPDDKKSDGKGSAKSDWDDDDSLEEGTTVDTPKIGDYTTIAGLNVIELHGVGLVTGLDGTGGDPPPSMYRTQLLEEMKRRGINNPNLILQSPNTALVLVRAYLPPLIRKGEAFDVDIRAIGNDETTSLNGGWLMETYLTEEAIVPGQGRLEGHEFGKVKGPIMVSTGEGTKGSSKALLTRGKILGGGISLKDRDLALYLRNDFRNVRNSKRIADRIGLRFFNYNEHGLRESLAEAKTDQKVDLKLLPRYKDNFPRYLQVIRHIAFRETEVAQRVRMQKLKEKLSKPETAELAAIELEAIGALAVPILKAALKDKSLEVRFHAGLALAYLGEADGLKALAEAAREEPAFRVFAFAAMATVDDAESHVLLKDLMNGKSSETRYGAFRALTTLDPNDPFVRPERLNGQFNFHVMPVDGAPMIHMTARRKAEVVLFGAEQEFRTPMAVRAGTKILVTGSAGTNQIVVSRYEVGKPDRREVVSTRVADVIRKAAEFGATYPDIAQLLSQAARQQNAPGSIEIDALPKAGLFYQRPIDGKEGATKKVRISKPAQAPNLFSEDKDFNASETPAPKPAVKPESVETAGGKGSASVADVRPKNSETAKSDGRIQQVKAEVPADDDEPEMQSSQKTSRREKSPTKESEKNVESRSESKPSSKSESFFPFKNPFRKGPPAQVEPESLNE